VSVARLALVLILLASGCGSGSEEPRAGGEPLSHWAREARLVSFFTFWNSEKDERRHEAFRRLVEIGEPAVPVLMELLEEDVPVSGDALNALCGLGPRVASAVPALVRALERSAGERRTDAALVLGCIGPDAEAAVPALAALMSGPDDHLRELAAHSLGAIGGSGRDALERAVRDADPRVRKSAVAGLAPGGAGAAPPAEYLAAALEDPAPEVRARAFEVAHPGSREEADAMIDAVLRGMRDESELVRAAAHHWYVGVYQHQTATPRLIASVLAGGDAPSRVDAAWRLGSDHLEQRHFHRAPALAAMREALVAALTDPEAVVRIYAARGLSADPQARERLAPILRDAMPGPGVDVRARVIAAQLLFSLAHDPRDVTAAYADGLRADDPWIQLAALSAIREMGRAGEELRPEIERLRASPEARVRDQAGWLLTQLADRSR